MNWNWHVAATGVAHAVIAMCAGLGAYAMLSSMWTQERWQKNRNAVALFLSLALIYGVIAGFGVRVVTGG